MVSDVGPGVWRGVICAGQQRELWGDGNSNYSRVRLQDGGGRWCGWWLLDVVVPIVGTECQCLVSFQDESQP